MPVRAAHEPLASFRRYSVQPHHTSSFTLPHQVHGWHAAAVSKRFRYLTCRSRDSAQETIDPTTYTRARASAARGIPQAQQSQWRFRRRPRPGLSMLAARIKHFSRLRQETDSDAVARAKQASTASSSRPTGPSPPSVITKCSSRSRAYRSTTEVRPRHYRNRPV